MNLFGFEIRRKDSPVPQTGFWHRITEPFAGAWQHNVECDGTERVQAFSAVYACMTRIANDIAKMPLLLVQRDDDGIWSAVDRPSPFWPVLRKPNAYQNRIQFMVCWILSKLQTGNAYILKQRDARGIVVALYVLDPRRVWPMITTDGRVFYRLAKDDLSKVGDEVNVPASEIIHDLMNPLFHPLAGVSPLYACGMAATQGNRIQANSAVHFQNNSMPSGILSAPGDVGDKQAEEWAAQWRERFSGRNRGNVAFLGGGLKYEAITMSAGESQLIEQLKWTAEDVARAFGVPLYKINAGPVPISNNAEVINLQYFSDTLQTLIESVEVCMDEGLGLGEAPNANLGTEFDLTVLLRMDSASQIDMLSKGVSGAIYSPNEARAIRNLPPVKGGETPYLQQQNFSLSALSVRDSGDPFAKPAPAPAPEPDDDPADVGEDQMRALLGRVSKAALGVQAR
jgi:HK97 family phage portal protein